MKNKEKYNSQSIYTETTYNYDYANFCTNVRMVVRDKDSDVLLAIIHDTVYNYERIDAKLANSIILNNWLEEDYIELDEKSVTNL